MPIFGTLAPDTRAESAPVSGALAEDAWESEKAAALTVSYEVDDSERLALLPPALHPSIPLYAHVTVRSHESSPVGAFSLAELRLMSRAGSHYGGYTVGAIADTPEATDFLRARYGYAVRLGRVELTQRYHGAHASAHLEGRCVLDMAITDPQPITPGDLLVTASFHLARVGDALRLIQSEPSYSIEMIQRGRPALTLIDTEAFGDGRVKLVHPIVATYLEGSFKLERVRYLIDPSRPATEGTVEV